MKCKNCKAAYLYNHPESYEIDFYCLVGVEDKDRIEFKDQCIGCKTPRQKINKILKEEADYQDQLEQAARPANNWNKL